MFFIRNHKLIGLPIGVFIKTFKNALIYLLKEKHTYFINKFRCLIPIKEITGVKQRLPNYEYKRNPKRGFQITSSHQPSRKQQGQQPQNKQNQHQNSGMK